MDSDLQKSVLPEYFVGAALGLLVGILLGLTTAPVVAPLMAGLVALLTSFFSLGSKLMPDGGATTQRLIGFCLTAVVAALLALVARTHDIFSPPAQSMQTVARELKTLGFSDNKIQELLATRFFGVVPAGMTVAPVPKQSEAASTKFFQASQDDCIGISQLLDRRFLTHQVRLQKPLNLLISDQPKSNEISVHHLRAIGPIRLDGEAAPF